MRGKEGIIFSQAIASRLPHVLGEEGIPSDSDMWSRARVLRCTAIRDIPTCLAWVLRLQPLLTASLLQNSNKRAPASQLRSSSTTPSASPLAVLALPPGYCTPSRHEAR